MRVHIVALYRTRVDSPWSQDEYAASKFIKAIKGRQVNGHAMIPVTPPVKLEAANAATAPQLFARLARPLIEGTWNVAPVTLVPCPNSDSTPQNTTAPRPLALAQALAALSGGRADVSDCLRFRRAQASASSAGGTRSREMIFPQVVVQGALPRHGVVLVDDVMTSGGHLQAFAARLVASGATVVTAVVAGRSQQQPCAKVWHPGHETLDDWVPLDLELE